jgi:hypothetical protein
MDKATAMNLAHTLALALEDLADEQVPLSLDGEGTDTQFQVADITEPRDQGSGVANFRVRLQNGQVLLVVTQAIGED